MSRSHKVQVTLNEVEYAAIRRRAEAEGRKHASVVREAIQEYCVKPDRRLKTAFREAEGPRGDSRTGSRSE